MLYFLWRHSIYEETQVYPSKGYEDFEARKEFKKI